jgi:hypothetical protein
MKGTGQLSRGRVEEKYSAYFDIEIAEMLSFGNEKTNYSFQKEKDPSEAEY